jgi:hypothetical protein
MLQRLPVRVVTQWRQKLLVPEEEEELASAHAKLVQALGAIVVMNMHRSPVLLVPQT